MIYYNGFIINEEKVIYIRVDRIEPSARKGIHERHYDIVVVFENGQEKTVKMVMLDAPYSPSEVVKSLYKKMTGKTPI